MNFSIGLTGLKVAQQAIELIGTNLANAATEGYHRQELSLSPLQLSSQSNQIAVGGVKVNGIIRSYDILLERECLRQNPTQGQLEQELSALTSINNVLAQVDGNALAASIEDYFGAMTQLASDPNSLAYAQNTVWTADALTSNIRSAQEFLEQMKDQVYRQAVQLVQDINVAADNIGELNGQIELSLTRGTSANLLMDQRDEAVTKVSTLAQTDVQTMSDTNGQVQVQAWGSPLVLGERVMHITVGISAQNKMGVSPEGQMTWETEARGGELGGLMELYNEIIPDMEDRLNTLAKEIMLQVNSVHVQGVGTEGGFTDLTGVAVDSTAPISSWDWPPVTANESFMLHVTDDTGASTNHEITILETDTLDDIADRINNLPTSAHITASVVSGRLHIEALTDGYTFDFRPDYTMTTTARKETFTGYGASDPTLAYLTGNAAGDTLTLDLGTAPADVLTYNIGAASRSLDQVVSDINTLSTAVDATWNAASKQWDSSTSQWRLVLSAHQDGNLGAGEISVTNVGAVVWAVDGEVVAEGENNLEFENGLTGLDGTGGGAGAPTVALDGIYEGPNQEYIFTVGPVGGDVGNVNNMQLTVTDGEGSFVKQIDIGYGYSVGDRIEIENGLVITIGEGQLNAGESFGIMARSESDTSGFLSAAGMNTFFEGVDAGDMEVRQRMYDDAHNIATSRSTTGDVDSKNIERLAALGSTTLAALGDSTFSDYHADWVSDIGQQTLVRESRLQASEAVLAQLANQRDAVSGVDPNEQATQLLIYERMFQSMSKLINVQDKSLQTLMDII